MRWRSTSPSVGFFSGEGFAVIGFDVAPLGSAEPKVVAFKQRVEVTEVAFGILGVLEVSTADGFQRIR